MVWKRLLYLPVKSKIVFERNGDKMDKHYEKHKTDNDQPIIFHTDYLNRSGYLYTDDMAIVKPKFPAHWHENIELLYMLEGECDVITNAVKIHTVPGDIALINSNMVHMVEATTEYAKYYCLIVDVNFLKSFGINIEHTVFERCIRDSRTLELYLSVVRAAKSDDEYRMLDLKLALLSLAVNIVKNHSEDDFSPNSHSTPKTEIVKKAIEYMKEHYAEQISVEELAKMLGFTKYYFCHIFNEITGSTVINHLNYVRCKNARKLIMSGKCNITEAAEQSGFTNMSYFAKIYKNVIGQLPSETKAEAKHN